MENHTITTGKRFPVTAVAVALALAVVVSILAMQGLALMTTETTHPVVVQQGASDVGSNQIEGSPCSMRSSRTPARCFSGSAGREEAGGMPSRPTIRRIIARKS
jgi:hypothetical protein